MTQGGVSVVIPVFNRQEQGVAAARSALMQEGCAVEVLIVDDASPRAFTLPQDLACDARVRLIRADANGGPAAARNLGIRAATYSWIAFLDSDDRFLPGKLAKQLALADPCRPLDVIATGFTYARRITGAQERLIPIETDDISDFCAGCWHCPGTTALVNRSAFDLVGPLRADLRRLEDLEWFIRLGLAGGALKVVPEVLAWIDVDANASIANVDAAAAQIASRYLDRPRALPSAEARTNLSAYLALEQAAARFKKGSSLSALVPLARSFWLRPRASLHLRAWWGSRVCRALVDRPT